MYRLAAAGAAIVISILVTSLPPLHPKTQRPTAEFTDSLVSTTVAAPAVPLLVTVLPPTPTPLSQAVVPDLAPDIRIIPAALASAVIDAFPFSERDEAFRVATCETGGTFRTDLVGAAGEVGLFQVQPLVWGPVPSDVYGQAQQAAAIVLEYGWGPWSCR